MRLVLVGVGGIGGPLGGFLHQAGADVLLVTGNEEIAAAISRDGVRVTGVRGEHTVRGVRAVPRLGAGAPSPGAPPVTGPFDAALLVMKSDRLAEGVRDALPFLAPGGFVVCMQNGLPERIAAPIAGEDRVLGGVVGWGGTMDAPGVYRVTSKGDIIVGEGAAAGASGRSERLRDLVRLLGLAMPARATSNLAGVRWSKLAINCAITTVGAVAGLTLGELARMPLARRLFLTVISEVIDVARAEGVRLEPVTGTLNLESLHVSRDRPPSRIGRALRDTVMRVVALRYRRVRSSMLQSLERGRRAEVDWLNGVVVEAARAKGTDAPLNARLVDLVHAIERGERKPDPANLEALSSLTR